MQFLIIFFTHFIIMYNHRIIIGDKLWLKALTKTKYQSQLADMQQRRVI